MEGLIRTKNKISFTQVSRTERWEILYRYGGGVLFNQHCLMKHQVFSQYTKSFFFTYFILDIILFLVFRIFKRTKHFEGQRLILKAINLKFVNILLVMKKNDTYCTALLSWSVLNTMKNFKNRFLSLFIFIILLRINTYVTQGRSHKGTEIKRIRTAENKKTTRVYTYTRTTVKYLFVIILKNAFVVFTGISGA